MPTPTAHQQLQDARNLADARRKFGDHLDRALDWAQGNLPKDELEAFNASMDAPPHARDLAIGKLIQRHIRASHAKRVQQAAQQHQQQLAAGEGPQPFTHEERAEAVSDPRYLPKLRNGMRNPAHDPAYAAEVRGRLLATAAANPPRSTAQ
jgi:hypothetical protein